MKIVAAYRIPGQDDCTESFDTSQYERQEPPEPKEVRNKRDLCAWRF